MKKILIFSTAYYPLVGGAEVAIKEITDRLTDFEFEMITARTVIRTIDSISTITKDEKIGNVMVHRVGFGKPIDKILLPFLGVWKALSLYKKDEIQIIWPMMASYGGFAALIYTWFRPEVKMMLTLQEGDPPEYILKRVRPFGYFFKQIFRRADAIQAISKFLADWGKQMGFKGEPVIVPNGVDIPKFKIRLSQEERSQLRKELTIGEGEVVMVTASRLVLKNATDDLIKSLKFLPENFKVLVIGDGEDRAMLDRLVLAEGLASRVIFLGYKSHDELPRLLQAADIFCRPSLSEGLGNSFLEAMVAGLPVVATPVGGIPDFLVDGKTGLFCKPRKPETIAAAARRIAEESGLRDTLIKNAMEMVEEKYSWEGVATLISLIFAQINHD